MLCITFFCHFLFYFSFSSSSLFFFFFFNDTATTEIYTLSLHDALPILIERTAPLAPVSELERDVSRDQPLGRERRRSEEHTSELQSHVNLVCRLLLEKKKKKKKTNTQI